MTQSMLIIHHVNGKEYVIMSMAQSMLSCQWHRVCYVDGMTQTRRRNQLEHCLINIKKNAVY